MLAGYWRGCLDSDGEFDELLAGVVLEFDVFELEIKEGFVGNFDRG